jgi:hypothetical protein
LLFGIALVEILLGLHLLFQPSNPWTWFSAVFAFTVFFAMNMVQIVMRVPNCECFGRLSASPWQALAVDGMALVSLLLAVRTDSVLRPRVYKLMRPTRARAILATLFVVIGVCIGQSTSVRIALLDFVEPSRLLAGRTIPDALEMEPAQHRDIDVSIVNRTGGAVTLLAKQGRCGIRFRNTFPVRIPPCGEIRLPGYVVAKHEPGEYVVPAVLITDSSEIPFVVVSSRVKILNRN